MFTKSVRLTLALTACVLAAGTISASAATIPAGTVSSAHLFTPTVNITSTPSTYSAMSGGTFEVTATGGLAGAASGTGTLNGTLTFSNTEGTTTSETLNNFFVFSDGSGGTFNFSVSSVTTMAFASNSGSTGFQLYLLGTTLDTKLGYTPTPTSLTITANSTGGSAYSSSATLAIPPTSATPEPSSLMLLGTGLVGLAGVARRRLKL